MLFKHMREPPLVLIEQILGGKKNEILKFQAKSSIIWKSFYNYVPTGVNLRNHHVEVDGICPVCSRNYETIDYAFVLMFSS